MTDELLPTPTAGDARASGSRNTPRSKAHPGVSLSDLVITGDSRGRTSRSSPGSEDSTSPSRPSDSSASPRSSGTSRADVSLSDGGRLFPVGPMCASSPLLPTPSANQYEAQDADRIRARREREMAKGRNGNGFGLTTAMALTLLPAGSPASQSASQGGDRDRPTTAGSGPSSLVAFGSFDPDGSFSRTYRDFSRQESLLDQPSEKSSVTWPRSGSMRSGRVYERRTLARVTDGSGSSSLLPTATADDAKGDRNQTAGRTLGSRLHDGVTLTDWARLLPTPTRRDHKGRNQRDDGTCLPGALLPTPRHEGFDGLRGDRTSPRSDDGSES